MGRFLSRSLSVLAVLMLTAFALQLGIRHAEQAGWICGCHHSLDTSAPPHDHDHACPAHAHAMPGPLLPSLSVACAACVGTQSFDLVHAVAPDGPVLAIDQPPKLA